MLSLSSQDFTWLWVQKSGVKDFKVHLEGIRYIIYMVYSFPNALVSNVVILII